VIAFLLRAHAAWSGIGAQMILTVVVVLPPHAVTHLRPNSDPLQRRFHSLGLPHALRTPRLPTSMKMPLT
jgi:hypothetical protein